MARFSGPLGGSDTGNWTFNGDYATTENGELGIDGTLLVNTIEGTSDVEVTRLLIQASGNGDSYIRVPTNSVSSTENLIIGNELSGIQLVGGVVLDSELGNIQLSGGTNVDPTSIPLTQGYAVLNEGTGTWFDLPDGQEGQLMTLILGLIDGASADDFTITMANAHWSFDLEGTIFPKSGPAIYQPFTQIPAATCTLIFAQGNWNIPANGIVTDD